MYRDPVIVQISDLHFGKSVNLKFWKSSINEDAKQALKNAILRLEPHPEFLVVTGDIANRGQVKEMNEGKEYLESILDTLWDMGHATRCILVPGNHDVWATTWARPSGYLLRDDRLKEWNSVFGGWSFLAPNLPPNKGAEVRPFSILNYYQERGMKNPEELATRALQVCEYFPSYNLAFLKLDSNVKQGRGPARIARGMVGLPQRTVVDEILQHYKTATSDAASPFGEARRIALVHHHVTRLPNVKLEKWMMMEDAGQVARWLARHGIRLVLHGHFHWADVLGLTYWNTESNNSKVETIVVSAGSATALDIDDRHNSCHHITLGHFRTTVKRPKLDDGEFQPLAAAETFTINHKLRITLQDPAKIPVFLDALEALVVREEEYADEKHTYTLLKSTGFIDADRTYYGNVELHGINITTDATTEIPFVFSAVGAQYFHDFDCRAWDIKTNKALMPPKLIEERPICLFPSLIYFNKPLRPNETFQIRVQFHLKMVMLEERDFDMLSLLRFARGVARVEMAILSEKTIVAPKLFELRGDQLKPSTFLLREVNMIPTAPPGKGSMAGYEVNIDSPSALTYLMFYEKLTQNPLIG